MANITSIAKEFFEACEAGKGWEGCRAHCLPDASFSAQSEPLADIRSLRWDTAVMAYLHGHNVRGYVAFNTLIFSDELS